MQTIHFMEILQFIDKTLEDSKRRPAMYGAPEEMEAFWRALDFVKTFVKNGNIELWNRYCEEQGRNIPFYHDYVTVDYKDGISKAYDEIIRKRQEFEAWCESQSLGGSS